MIVSRIAAIVILLAAIGWIASGHFGKADGPSAAEVVPQASSPLFRVAVMPVETASHQRSIVVSGRTEADKRATAIARTAGVVEQLDVRRGSAVKTGDVIAVLSDEAREANLMQAKARLEQRRAEYEAKMRLIKTGNLPSLNQPQIEADLRSAEADMAQAEAEATKGQVLAPITGIVNEVPVQVGQALQVGGTVAEIIALQPMLAVVEIAERQLGGVQVGDEAQVRLVTGETAKGNVRFISRRASPQTRTYRVEIGIENEDGRIPDGVTAEVALRLAPVLASRVPRSALTFSSEGKLGVRTVQAEGKVGFAPVQLVEDGQDLTWVGGLGNGTRVIVQGQDFVKEGEAVEAVPVSFAARR